MRAKSTSRIAVTLRVEKIKTNQVKNPELDALIFPQSIITARSWNRKNANEIVSFETFSISASREVLERNLTEKTRGKRDGLPRLSISQKLG